MLLAIDTSTDIAALALAKDDRIVAETSWRCGQNHSVELLPHLTRLLKEADSNLRDTEAVVVAKGPGSYNGLRVGLSTAKGLAFSLEVPVIGVSSLASEAYPHAESGLPVCPIFNAGRGEIAAALYQKTPSGWQTLVPEHIATLETLADEINEKTLFCGEYVADIARKLKKTLGDKAVIAPDRMRSAVALIELARPRIAQGDYDDPATLQPLYLRRPHITKPKKNFAKGGPQ